MFFIVVNYINEWRIYNTNTSAHPKEHTSIPLLLRENNRFNQHQGKKRILMAQLISQVNILLRISSGGKKRRGNIGWHGMAASQHTKLQTNLNKPNYQQKNFIRQKTENHTSHALESLSSQTLKNERLNQSIRSFLTSNCKHIQALFLSRSSWATKIPPKCQISISVSIV